MYTKYEYDNIMSLAKKANFKKIIIMRDSWNYGNWAIVNSVTLNPDGKYGSARGHIHYANGDTKNGDIFCAGCYTWRTVKVLEDDMKVIQRKARNTGENND